MKFPRFHIGLSWLVLISFCCRLTAQVPAPPAPTPSPLPSPVAPTATPIDGPMIAFDNKVYEFGKAWSGEPVKHVFVVTNIGNAPLEITNVHPSCGCTTAGDYSHKIAPGQTGTISIQFDNSRYNGPVTKTIEVFSNAKNLGQAKLTLHGTVKKALEVAPMQAVITVQDDSENAASASVKIINNTDNPVTVSEPTSSNKAYTSELKTVTPGHEYELIVSVQPPFTNANPPATITLKTSMGNSPTLRVTAIASIQKAVQVSPAQITLGPPASRWMTNRVFIRGNGSMPLVLQDPQSSDSRLEVKIVPLGSPNMFNLIVAIPPDFEIPKGQRVVATLKSNHPRYPVVTIPIFQRTAGFAGARYPMPSLVKRTSTNGVAPPHP